MKNRYRIIKVTRQIGDTFYLAQKRVLFIFWITFTESVPIGFADMMELEVRYESYQDAVKAIIEDFCDSRHNKENKEATYPDIEDFS